MWWWNSTRRWSRRIARNWPNRRKSWCGKAISARWRVCLNLEFHCLPPDNPPMKKLFIKTYGCQMNAYDSARMADLLAPLGYVAAEAPEDADMVILNTCHIREKAAEKV